MKKVDVRWRDKKDNKGDPSVCCLKPEVSDIEEIPKAMLCSL